MRLAAWHSAYVLFPTLVLLHLFVSPYTKVEESFNVQATHDILNHGIPSPFERHPEFKFLQQYDHMTFPGAVPRTFIGALVLSGLAQPLIWYGKLDKASQQMLVRAVLGLLNTGALLVYVSAVRKAYGQRTAWWFTFVLASQFHVFYYASRTIPNMFAFAISTCAISLFLPSPGSSSSMLARRPRVGLYLLTIATVIFRSELALLGLSFVVQFLITTPISRWFQLIRRIFIPAIAAGTLAGLTLTVTIDTYFWRPSTFPNFLKQPLWPELAAFLSNVFPKSGTGASAWGTSPWHWYLTSAIPRLLLNPLLLPLSLYPLFTPQRNTTLQLLLSPVLYTALYSYLPHKETRFLFPLIPALTLLPATALSHLSTTALRSRLAYCTKTILIFTTLLTSLLSHFILLPLSSLSYPGAHALTSLHTLPSIYHPTQRQINVHLCNLALQTGVTKFLEKPIPKSPLVVLPGSQDGKWPGIRTGGVRWVYDKSDNDTGVYAEEEWWRGFDYVVVEEPGVALPGRGWDVVDKVAGLGRVRVLGKDEGRGALVLGADREGKDGIMKVLEEMYGSRIGGWVGWWYAVVHDILREGVGLPGGVNLTGGRWIGWGMNWKLYVMKKSIRR